MLIITLIWKVNFAEGAILGVQSNFMALYSLITSYIKQELDALTFFSVARNGSTYLLFLYFGVIDSHSTIG